ncbi:hypothetical protein [Lysinibacillus sp. NPDC056185]|uniref:hypothetical protein n=1 Tax=Lysinibacillus sp. NPDC056185 TaxID=3345739 RepID=UPI0039F0D0C8
MKKLIIIRILAFLAVSLILFADGVQTDDFLFLILFSLFFIGIPWYEFLKIKFRIKGNCK